MGTSSASTGPGAGVAYDPPWLDQIAAPSASGEEAVPAADVDAQDHGQNATAPGATAPAARFRDARRALGQFARTGSEAALRRAIGHYSRTGMGGAKTAARRMRLSTAYAGNLYAALHAARDGSDPAITEWVIALAARAPDARDVIDEIVRRVAPPGGSVDETTCRESMAQALQGLIERYPRVDLLHLEEGAIWSVVELFLAREAFFRLCLDIGQVFEDPRVSPRDRVRRMNEMREFLEAEIFAQVQKLRVTAPQPSSAQLRGLLQRAVQNTFLVCEGEL